MKKAALAWRGPGGIRMLDWDRSPGSWKTMAKYVMFFLTKEERLMDETTQLAFRALVRTLRATSTIGPDTVEMFSKILKAEAKEKADGGHPVTAEELRNLASGILADNR